MIIKQWLTTFVLVAVTISVSAQVEEKVEPEENNEQKTSRLSDRLVFGGDIGLSFGSITYIKLAPVIGYRITDRFTAGLGPIYIYEKYKDFNLETSTYGGKGVLSFTVIKGDDSGGAFPLGNIVIHLENEVVNVEAYEFDYSTGYSYLKGRVWIDNLLAGLGLQQPIAGRFGVSMFILWDITQNKYSPYTNPIFKFGFNF
jgi:long-subunit fatty acid transport protein